MALDTEQSLFQLSWPVALDGYSIIHYEAEKPRGNRSDLFLLPAHDKIQPNGTSCRSYDPFQDQPGLARKFAGLTDKLLDDGNKAHKSFLSFSNKYGLLGLNTEGEDLNEWERLSGTFWDIFMFLDNGNIDAAVNVFNNFGPNPRLRMVIDEKPKNAAWRRSPRLIVTTLYGAMWMMVADELSKGIQLQPCNRTGCGEWFKIRSNKMFCSQKCKVAYHRDNKVTV